jgi:formamidopyrimidine-DNA glycosylase
MPELPEVEVTRLSFADRIRGARVLSVKMGKPLRWPLACEPVSLVNAQVMAVRRRGKYLLLDLKHEPQPMGALESGLLLIHLGMSGSLSFMRRPGADKVLGVHDHFEMATTQGTLTLNDPRRFGAVVFAESQASDVAQKLLGKLGMEPLSDDAATGFDLEKFRLGLKARSAPIKQVLLGGELVVGVGNIYASEALYMAGIRPTRKASAVSRARALKLHGAIRQVLARAVERGGSTLRDFSNADGQAGHFQLEAMVYGRAGEPCKTCATPIKSIRQGQRSSFFCPKCQKP